MERPLDGVTTAMRVWLDGRLVAAAEARVSVYDRGFRSGEGVFETIRAYGTHPFRLDAHLARATAGASALGFTTPPTRELAAAVDATATANAGHGDLVLRLTVTPGVLDPATPFPGEPVGDPTVVVTAQPLALDEGVYARGAVAACVRRARELPEVKAVSYATASLARREAVARGADEALLVSPTGDVLEGSYSNVFAVVDGTVVTPPADAGILSGVTRQVVLELASALGCATAERPVTIAEVRAAEEAFLTATTREIVPLVRVDDGEIGDGRPGPIARRLLEAYRAEVRREAEAARSGTA